MTSLYVLIRMESPISSPMPRHELVEVQHKVSRPSWTIPDNTLAYIYRQSWGKHPDTPNVANVNTFAKFRFEDAGQLLLVTGALQSWNLASADLNDAISEAREKALLQNVPFHVTSIDEAPGWYDDSITDAEWRNEREGYVLRWRIVEVKL